VRNVTAGYGTLDVLKDISFDIHARRTVAVVGESGSGKSTTARVITGLLPPRRGEILFNGEALPPDYRNRSRDQLRQAQMIYQMADTALNPKLRIRDLIGRPAQMYLGLRAGRWRTGQGPPVADRAGARRTTSTASHRSCRAARSSASASPGRWPPSRSSSSATRSPPPSTSLSPKGS
jgi:ABC-type glutathione transport system ATPase component